MIITNIPKHIVALAPTLSLINPARGETIRNNTADNKKILLIERVDNTEKPFVSWNGNDEFNNAIIPRDAENKEKF